MPEESKILHNLLSGIDPGGTVIMCIVMVWSMVWVIMSLDFVLQVNVGTRRTKIELNRKTNQRTVCVGDQIYLRVTIPHWSGCDTQMTRWHAKISRDNFAFQILPKGNQVRSLEVHKDYSVQKYNIDDSSAIHLAIRLFNAGTYFIMSYVNGRPLSERLEINVMEAQIDPKTSVVLADPIIMMLANSRKYKCAKNLMKIHTKDVFKNRTGNYNIEKFTFALLHAAPTSPVAYEFCRESAQQEPKCPEVILSLQIFEPGIYRAAVKYSGIILSDGIFTIVATSMEEIETVRSHQSINLFPAVLLDPKSLCLDATRVLLHCTLRIFMKSGLLAISRFDQAGSPLNTVSMPLANIKIRLLSIGNGRKNDVYTFQLKSNSLGSLPMTNNGDGDQDLGVIIRMNSCQARVFISHIGMAYNNNCRQMNFRLII